MQVNMVWAFVEGICNEDLDWWLASHLSMT
jgi:hypothetical protein